MVGVLILRIRDIRTRRVEAIAAEASLAEAAKRMREAGVGCLVILGTPVVGIITDRDLAVWCISQGHDAGVCPGAHHMSCPVVTASPDGELRLAVQLMMSRRVKRLPIVEHGRLVGILSLSDVVQAMEEAPHDLMAAAAVPGTPLPDNA